MDIHAKNAALPRNLKTKLNAQLETAWSFRITPQRFTSLLCHYELGNSRQVT